MLATLGYEKKHGYSPYLLMFGREARLPVDLGFCTSPNGAGDRHHSWYVGKLREDLQKTYELASQATDRTIEHTTRKCVSRLLTLVTECSSETWGLKANLNLKAAGAKCLML